MLREATPISVELLTVEVFLFYHRNPTVPDYLLLFSMTTWFAPSHEFLGDGYKYQK